MDHLQLKFVRHQVGQDRDEGRSQIYPDIKGEA